eukprot:TRINITY_DN23618_c0_g1_i1.p1 TRINITY_DN23618_c0_g1~~TRINITY_DN23618_c0_g1_i1.p1  ORF type:complete len:691 (-),score=130.24 TRINITY_DN23618_c0_g1_i1:169-2037(-)
MQVDLCGNSTAGFCNKMKPFDGKLYKEYLKNIKFNYKNELVLFDANGDPPGHYDIMNFQQVGNNSMEYVAVGTWNNGTLNLHSPVQFHPLSTKHANIFESVCSKECGIGEFKHFQDGAECCWTCVLCREEQYLYNETACKSCHRGWWPNINKTGCDRIPIESLEWNKPESIFVIILAICGIIITIITTSVFIKYNHTPVVKSSSRELSYTILVGISLCFMSTFTLIQKPSHITCVFSRILPGTSIAFIYAALSTKTNRIARILAVKKMITYKPLFMTSTAQVIIATSLIGVEILAIVSSIVLVPPVPMLYYPSVTRVNLVCHTDWSGMIIPFGFDLFLMIVCTYYAVMTRNVPENFNEAKFIGFSCYTTCVIWLSYLPIWFGSDIKVIATCICLSLSAYVTLALQFFPKLYIILLQPHKNDRSFFTTSKEVRCHIGRGTGASKTQMVENNRRKTDPEPKTNSIRSCDGVVGTTVTRSETINSSLSSKTESHRSKKSEEPEETAMGLAPCRHGVQNMGSAVLSVHSLSESGSTQNGHLPNGRLRGWAVDKEKDGHSQTEEFRVFCVNCDTRVKVYPETDLRYFKKSLLPSRLSILEENSFSGNNDIKNIVISIDCKNQPNKGW